MDATIKQQSIKQDLMILFAATAIAAMSYQAVTALHYHAASKIEEGTVVVRNDSVTTIIIPDRR